MRITVILAFAIITSASIAFAQGPGATEVDPVAVDAMPRDTVDYAPSADVPGVLSYTGDIESLERIQAAARTLQELIDDTPIDDPERARYMFRLAELYERLSVYYEQRGFERMDAEPL